MMNTLVLAAALVAAGNVSPQAAGSEDVQRVVEREFRLYRIQVYNTYRLLRPEYDHRRRAGDAAYNAWRQAGGQAHQAEPLVQWFRAARSASHPQMIAALPPLPAFPEAIVTVPPAKAAAPKLDARRSPAVARQLPPHPAATRPQRHFVSAVPQPSKPAWQCVSQALIKGVVYGATRAVP